jgi:HAD superfamily hydrolase (TIGR01549 family)
VELKLCSGVLFDAADTLIELSPSLKIVIMEFSKDELEMANPDSCAREFVAASELWAGMQRRKEAAGAPKIASSDFFKNANLAGLRAILPDTETERLQMLWELLRKRFKGMDWVAAPDAVPVLESLKNSKHTLGLVSNFTPDLSCILEKQGLKAYFECIVVSSIVGVWKPDPQIMTYATNELSIPAEECVYIGDNPLDVQCSKDANMTAVWLNHDNRDMPAEISHEPDAVIRQLRELL